MSTSPALALDSEADSVEDSVAASNATSATNSSTELLLGTLVYCRLLVRGVLKVTEAVVVELGTWQTVVACPADCALDSHGGWAGSAELGGWQSFRCASVEPGTSCAVVFYSVDTTSLATAPVPGAVGFKSTVPSNRSLCELFHGEAGADSIRIQAVAGEVSTTEKPYHEVRISEKHSLFECNSVLLVPDLLTRDECNLLMEAAVRRIRGGRKISNSQQEGLTRLPVQELDLEAQMLSTSIIKDRVLTFLEQQLPQVTSDLFGQNSRLREMKCTFSQGEPAINRYVEGGGFNPHRDQTSVTINVLLSDFGDFSGGGTTFWPQDSADESGSQDVLLLRPPQGTGVLFNGNVRHAGRPVVSGTRYLGCS
ncbi:unnamed protein product [Polarella glacialis]|uniref:Fe2OG dioxygenase domain-containing protein n=1 Tax=Polarella glacialis TaxID=89957 RepID=A0A813H9B2_POLGL|nr:unnamed protein product [Polarella glacialis]